MRIVFVTLIGVFNFCIGQVNTHFSNDSLVESGATQSGLPKLVTHSEADKLTRAAHNIHCCVQDKSGNLWFGTTGDGVYRFDGKSFTNYTIKDGLISNGVYCMLEDKEGNIWFGTGVGVSRYDGTAITSNPIPDGNAVLRHGVGSMFQDKKGVIWFGTDDGVYCYSGKSLTPFLRKDSVINKNGLQLKKVERMLQDKNGNMWFCSGMGGGEGICCYDGKSIINFKPNGDVWVPYMLEDNAGNIWFSGRTHGYFRYDGKTFTDFTEKIGFNPAIEDQNGNICLSGKVGFGPVLEDNAGNIWFTGKMVRFGGEGGIWRYDGKSCMNYTNKGSLGAYQIWCMVKDNAGNIWIGTNNTGLFRFDGKNFICFSE
jgi:ligand-binding sensor domain-containing protein